MWRLTAMRYPEFSRSNEYIAKVLPRLLALAEDATKQSSTLLSSDQWHSFYMSPFELLNPPDDLEFDDIDPKAIQRLKKRLIQEIELEDGRLSWMSGWGHVDKSKESNGDTKRELHWCSVHVDKSKAISLCEELNDETKRKFHWHVYKNKPLLNFLSRGSHNHFLVGETESPLEMLELLEDQDYGFREWLSEPFAKQFDMVLSKAIDQKNLPVLECLLDGRRWIAPSHADKCFENARKRCSRLLEPMRRAHARASSETPTVESVTFMLEQESIVDILNLLPKYFRDLQNEAPRLIREMAISCYNTHADADLSKSILEIARRFIFKSTELNHRLEDDFKQIEELIRQERKGEFHLIKDDEKWAITKKGVFKGSQYFPASSIASTRFGKVVTRESYGHFHDFWLDFTNINGVEIRFAWSGSSEREKNEACFNNLVNAAAVYLFPSIIEKLNNNLKAGHTVQIGPCSVSEGGVQFETKGWLFAKKHFVSWKRLSFDVENDHLVLLYPNTGVRKQISLR
jgi:hypothetical protein